MTARHTASVLCFALLLVGCGPSPGGILLESSKAKLSPSDVPIAYIQAQVADNTAFAFALYGQLERTPGNLFFSPYSISSVLAMTWGARRATPRPTWRRRCTSRFRPTASIQPSTHWTPRSSAAPPAEVRGSMGGHLSSASRTRSGRSRGFQSCRPLGTPWRKTTAPGCVRRTSCTNPAAAVADINAWVSDETEGQIPSLLDAASIDKSTGLVLTNAVYFNASWANPFNSEGDRGRTVP